MGREGVSVQPCSDCHGAQVAAALGSTLVIVSDRLSPQREAEERRQRQVQIFVRLIIFVLAFLGLVGSSLYVILATSSGESWLAFLSRLPAGVMFMFSTALLAGCIGYASICRQMEVRHSLPRRLRTDTEEQTLTNFNTARLVLDAADLITPTAREIIFSSYHLANADTWRPTHFFMACAQQSSVQAMLVRLGVSPESLVTKCQHVLQQSLAALTQAVRSMILEAVEMGYNERRERLDIPLLFVAATKVDPVLQEVLLDSAIDSDKLKNVLFWQWNDEALHDRWRRHRFLSRSRPHNRLDRAMTAVATPVLNYFSQDLTEQAAAGALLPNTSRAELTDELFRLLEVGRPALLVGYPGVGKRAILEDAAERMAADDVPTMFADKRLVALSLPQLVGGVTPAEGQARVLQALDEATRSRNIVLVAEDLHGMVGLSSGQVGSVDLADVFARTVSERGLSMIATTTPEGYAGGLQGTEIGNMFQVLTVPEPTAEQTMLIAEERLGVVEATHGVYFSYDALRRLITLAQMLIHDQRFPQKVLSLLDELALWAAGRFGQHHLLLPAQVNEYMSQKLHLPLTEVTVDESEKLLRLEATLHERLIGQDEAVKTVVMALQRARAEVRDNKRPIASLLFLGPTGVGKTELAKAVAESYFGSEQHMVRFDMTEYQELASLSRLIGEASGGEVSHGVLTEAVRKNPYALVLLDEIEKAHHDIVNVFLQVLDDGRLTDSRGETVDFTNTIIIATSNAAANYIQDAVRGQVPAEIMERTLLEKELRPYFQPEFINRFDRVVVFRPLDSDQVVAITRLLLQQVANRLKNQGIIFSWTETGIAHLAKIGFDPVFGARPLRRVVQDNIDTELARLILAQQLKRRDEVLLTDDGTLAVRSATPL